MTLPIVRNSERRDAKRCWQRWWWAWREGLRDRGSPAPPLWFGTGIHIALAAWYCGPGTKRGPHPAETWESYCGSELTFMKTTDLTDDKLQTYVDAQQLGRVMMEEYVKRYGQDDHKLYIVPEQTGFLDIPWSDRQKLYDFVDGQIMARYAWTFDGVWRHAGTGWLLLDEHKTAKAITTNHLALDDQGGSYWAVAWRTLDALGVLKKGDRLRGIEYNFMRKSLPDTRPRDAEGYATNKPVKADYIEALEAHWKRAGIDRTSLAAEMTKASKATLGYLEALAKGNKVTVLGERSKIQPAEMFQRLMVHRTSKERAVQLRRIQDEVVHMQAMRDGLLPLTKNPTRDCSWDCRFYQMCQLQDNGGNWEDFKRLQFKQEDPYADHRKSTDEG